MTGNRVARRALLKTVGTALAIGTASTSVSGTASPAAGPTVYIGSRDGTLYAVDAATGSQQWAFTQPSDKVKSSPMVVDGTVYVGSNDNTLYAVDAATGNQQWAFTRPSDSVGSSPTVVADPDGGDSIGSRARLGTLGHHDEWRYSDQSIEIEGSVTAREPSNDGGETRTNEQPAERDDSSTSSVRATSVEEWLDGWGLVVSWLVGVAMIGPLVLGALLAVVGRLATADEDGATEQSQE